MSKKKFCAVQILIAVIVVVCMLANTYAWSKRVPEDEDDPQGSVLTLSYESAFNSSTATSQTYYVYTKLVEVEDDIFEERTVRESVRLNESYVVAEGDVMRFETIIDNTTDGAVTGNVSLLLKSVEYILDVNADPNSHFFVNVSVPTREFWEYPVYRLENYPWVRVIPSCEIRAGETVVFEWSVQFESAGTFSIGEIILEHF